MQQTEFQGEVHTGGDFVGRDKVIHGDEVYGNKISYKGVRPLPIDQVTLDAALARLAEMPLDTVPNVASPPAHSRMPLAFNPLFVGRETELKDLAAALKGGAIVTVGQIAAATGMGGIGKTQLATAFVHRYGQYFQGGVFWLNFDDPANIPAEIAQCGAQMSELRLDFAHLDLPEQVQLVLGAWQSELPRLLIFDNCEDPTLVAQWRPPIGNSRVLVTSRRSYWDAGLGVYVLALTTLTRLQSMELLRKFRPDLDESDAMLNQIADELGDLPLAIHLAGSFLARYRYDISPDSYLIQLQSAALLTHPSLQSGDYSPTRHDQHVARTFALSYKRLDAEAPTDSLALALLHRAAHFSPGAAIPRWLLLATLEQNPNEETDTFLAADALHRLAELGLIEKENDAVVLHRLLARFVLGVDVIARDSSRDAVERIIRNEANQICNAGIPAPLLSWVVHLRYITNIARERLDERSADLCNELGSYLDMLGEYAEAHLYYKQALAIYQEVLGEKHPHTVTSLSNLGYVLKAMGEYVTARPYYEQALAIRQDVLGKKHPDTANSLNNLGSLFQDMGEYAAARLYYEQALAISQKVLGEKHPDTARSLNNLGYLLQAMGEYAAARPYYEQALAIRQEVLEEKHPDTASSLNNLGSLLQDMGEYVTARLYYEQALAIYQEVLGEKHPHTASSLNNLGSLLQDMGEYVTARPYYEQALAITQEVLEEKHPAIARSFNNLGMLLKAMGEYAAARLYYEQALAITQEVLGKKHPHTTSSLNNLGMLLKAMGEYAAARPYYEQALAIRQEVLGEKHPATARSLNNLGMLLQDMGEYAAARPYYEQALAIRQEVLGEKHPNTEAVRRNLEHLKTQSKNV